MAETKRVNNGEKPFINSKKDLVILFCEGYTPKDIYEKYKLASRKTTYKYYRTYKEVIRHLKSESFVNSLARAILTIE